MTGSTSPVSRMEILKLAIADLRAETLLTFCLIGSLAAIGAPLLILDGLRTGIVESLRQDLVGDPVFREVRPAETRPYDETFFAALRARSDVDFVMEGITRGASSIIVSASDAASSQARPRVESETILDMLPTAPGDPLLTSYAAQVPDAGGAVLSAEAAVQLKVKLDDRLTLEIGRQRTSAREVETVEAWVKGVLPARADPLPRIYLPFALVRDIESYREGYAVSERDWPGSPPDVVPGFDGLYILSERPLKATVQSRLQTLTGFFIGEPGEPGGFVKRLGMTFPEEQSVFRLSAIERLAGPGVLRRVISVLRGQNYDVFPYVDHLVVTIEGPGGEMSPALPVRTSDNLRHLFEAPVAEINRIQVPADLGYRVGETVTLIAATDGDPVRVPAVIAALSENPSVQFVELSAALGGMLRRGQKQRVRYDSLTDRLRVERTSFRGFRLYTETIDQVPALVRHMQGLGVDVVAQVGTIERILLLDQGLMRLFLIIAIIGGAGASVVLLTSLYAAVERKQASLGHLRILGISRGDIFVFPVYQALIMALVAVAAAALSAHIIAALINTFQAEQLGLKGDICRITLDAHVYACLIALGLSFTSSFFAALRATRIDPADAMRQE